MRKYFQRGGSMDVSRTFEGQSISEMQETIARFAQEVMNIELAFCRREHFMHNCKDQLNLITQKWMNFGNTISNIKDRSELSSEYLKLSHNVDVLKVKAQLELQDNKMSNDLKPLKPLHQMSQEIDPQRRRSDFMDVLSHEITRCIHKIEEIRNAPKVTTIKPASEPHPGKIVATRTGLKSWSHKLIPEVKNKIKPASEPHPGEIIATRIGFKSWSHKAIPEVENKNRLKQWSQKLASQVFNPTNKQGRGY